MQSSGLWPGYWSIQNTHWHMPAAVWDCQNWFDVKYLSFIYKWVKVSNFSNCKSTDVMGDVFHSVQLIDSFVYRTTVAILITQDLSKRTPISNYKRHVDLKKHQTWFALSNGNFVFNDDLLRVNNCRRLENHFFNIVVDIYVGCRRKRRPSMKYLKFLFNKPESILILNPPILN